MAKKKRSRSLPKRIAGIKLPRSLRRAADTQLGAAIMSQLIVSAGKSAIDSPQVKRAVAEVQGAVGRFAADMANQARRIGAAQPDPEPVRTRRRREVDLAEDRPN